MSARCSLKPAMCRNSVSMKSGVAHSEFLGAEAWIKRQEIQNVPISSPQTDPDHRFHRGNVLRH